MTWAIEDLSDASAGTFYDPASGKDAGITSARWSQRAGEAGSLSVTMLMDRQDGSGIPASGLSLGVGRTVWQLLRDGQAVWAGRVSSVTTRHIDRTMDVELEGVMAALNDSAIWPLSGSYTSSQLLSRACELHSAQAAGGRGYALSAGTVGSSATHDWDWDGPQVTWDLLRDAVQAEGGYLYVTGATATGATLSWARTASYAGKGQDVALGSNALSIDESEGASDLVTAIYPVTSSGLSLSAGSGTSGDATAEGAYVYNSKLVSRYGWRCQAVTFQTDGQADDATQLADMRPRAMAYAAALSHDEVASVTCGAIDLADAGADVTRFAVGQSCHVTGPDGFDRTLAVTEVDFDLLDPSATKVTFGTPSRGIADYTSTPTLRAQSSQGESAYVSKSGTRSYSGGGYSGGGYSGGGAAQDLSGYVRKDDLSGYAKASDLSDRWSGATDNGHAYGHLSFSYSASESRLVISTYHGDDASDAS